MSNLFKPLFSKQFMDLATLKKNYALLEKQHKLPSFTQLNTYFDIDRLDQEHDFLLRDIRKSMMEKVLEFIRLTETLLTPNSAPPLFLQFVRSMNSDEQKKIQGVYETLINLELDSIACDIQYSASSEAALIKSMYESWLKITPDLQMIAALMKRNFSERPSSKKDKSYFG